MTNSQDKTQDQTSAEEQEIHQEVIPEESSAADAGAADGAAAADDKAVEDMSPAELLAETQRALEELGKAKDATLRSEAEMQNVRRRAEREVEHAVKYGVEKLVQNLLPVLDSLEKAIESAEQVGDKAPAAQAIIEGMGLCQKLFSEVLEKEGMKAVDPHGEPFDPNLHQAISMVENPEVEPNSVVAVVQKGYQLNGRLVRPAMVMVAKGSAPKVDESV